MLATKLAAIADAIRGKTGKSDGLTLDQMATEIAGIEAGGGETFPQKIYETDFVMDESVTANGTLCTISTGLSTNIVANGNELVLVAIDCEPIGTPSKHVKRMLQFISPNQGTVRAPAFGFYCNDGNQRKDFTSAVGAYVSAVTIDLSSITINVRFNLYPPAPGNYHLELYRLGVVV